MGEKYQGTKISLYLISLYSISTVYRLIIKKKIYETKKG